jgi:hypothetical protein
MVNAFNLCQDLKGMMFQEVQVGTSLNSFILFAHFMYLNFLYFTTIEITKLMSLCYDPMNHGNLSK